jgi:hypothetical protein
LTDQSHFSQAKDTSSINPDKKEESKETENSGKKAEHQNDGFMLCDSFNNSTSRENNVYSSNPDFDFPEMGNQQINYDYAS